VAPFAVIGHFSHHHLLRLLTVSLPRFPAEIQEER
jgi:hypothetical protein